MTTDEIEEHLQTQFTQKDVATVAAATTEEGEGTFEAEGTGEEEDFQGDRE
jgi:hypothetical protein